MATLDADLYVMYALGAITGAMGGGLGALLYIYYYIRGGLLKFWRDLEIKVKKGDTNAQK